MNRRGFISLLAGAAGAPFVPWRALIEPRIILPTWPRDEVLVHYGNWTPAVGHVVTCLADYGELSVQHPAGYSGYSHWAVAQAIYLGPDLPQPDSSVRGWYFMGGGWMTDRDRRDFIDAITNREGMVSEKFLPGGISLVRLKR